MDLLAKREGTRGQRSTPLRLSPLSLAFLTRYFCLASPISPSTSPLSRLPSRSRESVPRRSFASIKKESKLFLFPRLDERNGIFLKLPGSDFRFFDFLSIHAHPCGNGMRNYIPTSWYSVYYLVRFVSLLILTWNTWSVNVLATRVN